MKIAIIGISDKPNCTPLDESTNTGMIINRIINNFPNIKFYKTNLVNFAPLDEKGKLRYPTTDEIKTHMPHLLDNIKDCDFVICLGGKVEKSLKGKIENMILIKHPSYIWIYKRKKLDSYIIDVTNKINEYLNKSIK